MYSFTKNILILLLLFFSGKEISAQQNLVDPMINRKLTEVYGSEFFINRQEIRGAFIVLLNERIKYEQVPETADEKFQNLQNVPLLNKFNASLVHDVSNFNELTFNPLKYQMEFFSKKTEVYRINPDWIIVIAPQRF